MSYNVTSETTLEYLKSRSGRLTIFQTVVSLTAFIVMVTEEGYHPGAFKFFATVAFLSFLFALCLMVAHFTGWRKSMTSFPWLLAQVIVEFAMIGLFFISSTVVASKAVRAHAGSAATMGFFLMGSYCRSLYTDFKLYRSENSTYDEQQNQAPEYPATGQQGPGMPPPQYQPPTTPSTYQTPIDTKSSAAIP
ncbi:uncharacterized protein [Apostichopus japonicus]|uniref:uncharacterized protein n=1 Tax=Stichopus japonicus TaxID=307972 RepID=UPI003AB60243